MASRLYFSIIRDNTFFLDWFFFNFIICEYNRQFRQIFLYIVRHRTEHKRKTFLDNEILDSLQFLVSCDDYPGRYAAPGRSLRRCRAWCSWKRRFSCRESFLERVESHRPTNGRALLDWMQITVDGVVRQIESGRSDSGAAYGVRVVLLQIGAWLPSLASRFEYRCVEYFSRTIVLKSMATSFWDRGECIYGLYSV